MDALRDAAQRGGDVRAALGNGDDGDALGVCVSRLDADAHALFRQLHDQEIAGRQRRERRAHQRLRREVHRAPLLHVAGDADGLVAALAPAPPRSPR